MQRLGVIPAFRISKKRGGVPSKIRPVDKLLTWRKSGIIEGGEGNATEDAHGNDRRPGTEGTFSPKAGKRIRFVLCV